MASSEELSWALLEAAEVGDVKTLQTLLDAGVDVNYRLLEAESKGWDGLPALFKAARRGRAAVVKLLLEHGASTDNLEETSVFYSSMP